jgi:hypothetical protein
LTHCLKVFLETGPMPLSIMTEGSASSLSAAPWRL